MPLGFSTGIHHRRRNDVIGKEPRISVRSDHLRAPLQILSNGSTIHGLELVDIHLKRPTLEDVFIELTGKRLRE